MPAAKSLEREDILVQMANYPLNVETLITHCVYEGDAARRLVRLVSVQYQHLSYLIPTLTAIESRLNLLAQQQIRFPDYVATAFQQFLQWLNGDAQQPVRDRLTGAQEQLQQAWRKGRLNSEESILLIGLLERLLNFVRIADAYHSVSERVSDWTPAVKPGKASRAHKHVDKGLLLLSCFTAFIATFATCLFWIGSGWRDGSTAPMKLFLKGVLISMAISLIYVTLLIPQAVTFEALVICLAPGLFDLGLVIANPSTNLIGLIVATQIPGLIGMSHHFKPDLQLIVNAMISTLVGIAVALVLTLLIRNKRPAWTATRALRKGIRDLLQLITALRMNTATLTARQQFVARTLDRVNVILPRKRVDPAPELVAGGNLIAEAWLGANCYDYYTRHRHLLLANQIESAAMFHELSQFLKQRLKTLDSTPSPALLHELDVLLLRLEAAAQQENALFAPLFHLFNIRLSLYLGARWPQPLAPQNRT